MGRQTVSLVAGDTAPDLVVRLDNREGPQDLTNATLLIRLRNTATDVVTTGACSIDLPEDAGVVRFVWSTETLTPGEYLVEWLVTYVDATLQMFPNDFPLRLVIRSRV